MKKLVTALALATLAASPAFAAKVKYPAPITAAAGESYAYAAMDPYTVVVNGQIVGRDPDANVRLTLKRDQGADVN